MKNLSKVLLIVVLAGSLTVPASVALAAGGEAPRESGPGAGTVAGFKIESSPIALGRPAQPQTPFDKAGRRFALTGFESGSFEAWAYPLKLVRGVEFSFLLGSSTVPIRGGDIVRFVSAEPAVMVLGKSWIKGLGRTATEAPNRMGIPTVKYSLRSILFFPVINVFMPAIN